MEMPHKLEVKIGPLSILDKVKEEKAGGICFVMKLDGRIKCILSCRLDHSQVLYISPSSSGNAMRVLE